MSVRCHFRSYKAQHSTAKQSTAQLRPKILHIKLTGDEAMWCGEAMRCDEAMWCGEATRCDMKTKRVNGILRTFVSSVISE